MCCSHVCPLGALPLIGVPEQRAQEGEQDGEEEEEEEEGDQEGEEEEDEEEGGEGDEEEVRGQV